MVPTSSHAAPTSTNPIKKGRGDADGAVAGKGPTGHFLSQVGAVVAEVGFEHGPFALW